MPRHLLGKKSWNVYNTDNIEKVKRDEAAAAAREAAEEQRMQEVDAERRIKTLRGLPVEPLPAADNERHAEDGYSGSGRERKRRRIAGEDDTDRDIRLAKEADTTQFAKAGTLVKTRTTSDAPLTDHAGHINLFPLENSRRNGPKNPEAEAETARKKKEVEDQYTMRFSNAAGFKQAVGQKPWYHSLGAVGAESQEETASKDVWGNEDPRRKEREKGRMAADDPLAAIQRGVTELREVERERKRWKEQKNRELIDLYEAGRTRHRRKRSYQGQDDLAGFTLDTPAQSDSRRKRGHHREERQSHHRHRSQSHSRSRHRSEFHRHNSGGPSPHRPESNEPAHTRTESTGRIEPESEGTPASADHRLGTLRKERGIRERVERARATRMPSKPGAEVTPGWEKSSRGRYSTQFARS